MTRNIAFIVGFVLLVDRLAAWQAGTWKPDWKSIGAALLIGYAAGRILRSV